MKYTCLTICFALFVLFPFAQTSQNLVIVDATSRQPLPFSTVRFINKNLGVYSNENGRVLSNIESLDTLVISFVGYLNKQIIGKSLSPDSIFLHQDTAKLQEVIVKPFDPQGKPLIQGILGEKPFIRTGSAIAVEFAARIYISQDFDLIKVNEILIPLSKTTTDNIIRFHLYEGTENGMPGEELLNQDLRINDILSDRMVKVDLRSQNILTNSKMLFVSIEWLGSQGVAKGLTGPFVRFSKSSPSVNTFTRTINDATHQWVEFNPKIKSSNPPNLVAQVVVQPMKYRQ